MRATEQTRPAVARNRLRWRRYQDRIDPRRLVFIDETWVKTNMAPLRGWGPRGQRLVAHAPQGRWRTLTFIAALRHDQVTAPWVIDGPINGAIFRRYVESVLVPTLKPRDVVVLDNLGSHKGAAARAAIRALHLRHHSRLRPVRKRMDRQYSGTHAAGVIPERAPASAVRDHLSRSLARSNWRGRQADGRVNFH